MEEILKKKTRKIMKKKRLLDPIKVVIDPRFTKEILEYPNSRKLKPSINDPYDETKGPIDHIQTF